jgi:nucleoside-diphosphate-sugar epimerase
VKILVTGANGFLGRHVVAELVRRGHGVRAMVRPATDISRLDWDHRIEVYRADLRVHADLSTAFDGIDALVHLAATVVGDAEAQLAETVVGTTRLLGAMAGSRTRRLVLASTFSVYHFNGARGTLTEQTPLDPRIYERDGYAIAKTWQERITRRAADEQGWQLTVLRPGFIWGKGNEYLACLGQSFGPVHLVLGPRTRLPLTHVKNCADCFADAVESPQAIGQTFNVVDDDSIRAWKYMGEYLRGSGKGGFRVPVPYLVCLLIVHAAHRTSKLIFRGKGKLPSLLVPCRFTARFKPLRYPADFVHKTLGWSPRLSFGECRKLTWETDAPRPAPALPDIEMQESPAAV